MEALEGPCEGVVKPGNAEHHKGPTPVTDSVNLVAITSTSLGGKTDTTRPVSEPCNGSADGYAHPYQPLTSGDILRGIFPGARNEHAQNNVRCVEHLSKSALRYASSLVRTTTTGVGYLKLMDFLNPHADTFAAHLMTDDGVITASALPRISRTFFFLDYQLH